MVRGNTWKNWRMDILWRENVKHAIQNSLKTLCHGFIETCKLKKSKNKICLKTWVNVNVFIVMNRDYKRMILWNLKLNMQNYLLDIWALANDMIQFSWKMETWSHAFQRVQSGCKPGTKYNSLLANTWNKFQCTLKTYFQYLPFKLITFLNCMTGLIIFLHSVARFINCMTHSLPLINCLARFNAFLHLRTKLTTFCTCNN